tara:strand:- start:779 stop:970 length:192 start_codon:yes stop_codon:yes gene_type:complete
MIKKEFKINDILNAVNSISKIERKKVGIIKSKNVSTERKDDFSINNQDKSHKSEILVLDEMIE